MIETLAWPVWPHFAEDEINSVARVLRSGRVNYWTGDVCREFETEFARFCGAQYAVAMANGTVALEAALRALEIGPGDEVIVPARTFIATASCVAILGAVPVVADIEAYSQNISAATIAPCLSAKTKAIVVVHLAGLPCEMQPIIELAAQHHLYVVEDCAQAHGAMYRGQMVGTCGDIAAFSFCQDKIMTTAGEGGMVLTNDAQLWERVWAYKDHGKNWARANMPSMSDYRFVHDQFGSNGIIN
jgi:dTDP-4-amino-4,6-dideoxygalactose transaminase